MAAGEAGEREGRGWRGSPGLLPRAAHSLRAAAAALLGRLGEADALPCATSASIYPGFFQHPPRSSLISCIQIFTFGLFVLPVFHSKLNAGGVASLAGEAPLFSPQDGQSPARALTTPFQAPSTLPREEPGAKRVSAWTAQSMCPFSAEAARLLAVPVGRYSGGLLGTQPKRGPCSAKVTEQLSAKGVSQPLLTHFPS